MCRRFLSVNVVLILAATTLAAPPSDKPSRQPGRASITVNLPADATLWAQGVKTRSSGSVREFSTPPLAEGRRFTYLFRATWTERDRTLTQSQRVVVTAGAHVRVRFPRRPGDEPAPPLLEGRIFEGRIKDVRDVWGILILTVSEGKKARDIRFDISEARIVGPSGAEWKGQDLHRGDRVRVAMTANGRLVQQVSVLPDSTSGINLGNG